MGQPLVRGMLWVLVFVCGLFGLMFASGEADAARTGACTLTAEYVAPPRVGGEPYVISDLFAAGTNEVWIAGVLGSDYHFFRGFARRWDGSVWNEPAEGLSLSRYGAHFGGTNANDVWVLDDGGGLTHWDGASWKIGYALPYGIHYAMIEARATNDVWLGGGRNPNNGKVTFAHWNGSEWVGLDGPYSGSEVRIHDIAALTGKKAWAVGAYGPTSKLRAALLRWDGKHWKELRSPKRANTEWYGLAVVNKRNIWAVGTHVENGKQRAITMHWDGKKWRIVPVPDLPDPALETQLVSVTTLGNEVWAVGSVLENKPGMTTVTSLVLYWNGKKWLVVEIPFEIRGLNKIVTEGNDHLWMTDGTHIVRGDGVNWENEQGPSLGLDSGSLTRVKAFAPNDVWAFGTEAEHWDGTAFTVVSSADVEGHAARYLDVDGAGEKDLWMLGRYDAGGEVEYLVAHRLGDIWTRLPDPYLGEAEHALNALAVIGDDDIWVLGQEDDAGMSLRLALHWDGKEWSRIPMPPPAEGESAAMGKIYARGGNDVWALGTDMLHWDGKEWGVVKRIEVNAMAFVATDDIWAVTAKTALHFDGSEWQEFALPSNTSEANYKGLVAFAADDIYAVGRADTPFHELGAVVLHWDGVDWREAEGENLWNYWIDDAVKDGANGFWGVGTHKPFYGAEGALIYHFTRSCN